MIDAREDDEQTLVDVVVTAAKLVADYIEATPNWQREFIDIDATHRRLVGDALLLADEAA